MKDINECRERLRGIFNITVTPFTASGAIDFPALRENIERVIGLGYDGLLIGGTYGEFPVMTVEERRELFHQVMACVDDRVAVMLCSASAASSIGFNGARTVPPLKPRSAIAAFTSCG